MSLENSPVNIKEKRSQQRNRRPRKKLRNKMQNFKDHTKQENESNFENEMIVPTVESDEPPGKFDDCINLTSVFKSLKYDFLLDKKKAIFQECFLKLLVNFGRKIFSKPSPPNYFLCIRIKNDKIIDLVKDCHTDIKRKDPGLDKAFVKPETLHITLFAMFLRDEAHLNSINESLNSSDFASETQSNLALTFKGIAHFRNSVVYVDLLKDESYKQLISFQNRLVNLFENWGVNLSEKSFTPHMTLMKLSRSSHFHRQGIKKIDNSTYNEWALSHFGSELIDSIYLCNIREKQSDGFYKIHNAVELK